jgi:hypothetical protein
MPWTSNDCPVCGSEIRIHVTSSAGGHPDEHLIECDEWEGQCGCDLTDEQIEVLEQQAIGKADWSDPWQEGM